MCEWLSELGVTTVFIEPASPCANGYIEFFNGKPRDELLDGETFYMLKEAQILVVGWRRLYNGLRPHGSLGNRPPAPETIVFPRFSLTDYAPPTNVTTAPDDDAAWRSLFSAARVGALSAGFDRTPWVP